MNFSLTKKLLVICLISLPVLLKAQTKLADSVPEHNYTISTLVFPPKPNSLVTDYTKTLSFEELKKLESKLEGFSNEKTAQIVVVIMRSVGDNDIMFYGTRLGKIWGVGYKRINNGVLVLVALEDRKTAIIIGTGLEKTLPDEFCHQIIETDLIPNFKKQQFYTGLDECTDTLMKRIVDKK